MKMLGKTFSTNYLRPNSNIYYLLPQNTNMADPDGISPGILVIFFVGIISAIGILFKVNK